MQVERWPSFKRDQWGFLKKVASGISGRYCEVVPGYGGPSCSQVLPYAHFSRIYLPSSFSGRLLNGSLAHEILHVISSTPQAFARISWGVYLMANCLEDARIEHQLAQRWPGLVRLINELVEQVDTFRVRDRHRASSTDAWKLYQVGLALYLLLKGMGEEVFRKCSLQLMAIETARELLPLAEPALRAAHSFEVVEIAKKVVDELVRAAERAAARTQSPSGSAWVSALRQEVEKAKSITVEEVLIALGKPRWAGDWWGPWYKGGGSGFHFYATPWTWEKVGTPHPLHALEKRELAKLLEEADPTLEHLRVKPRALRGQLVMSSQVLVTAALGRDRRVFASLEKPRTPLLPYLLSQLEFLIFLEAHARYTQLQAALLKNLAASLARLLTMVGAPLVVVRAWNCVRNKEIVEDPQTKRRWERWSNDFYLRICTVKAPDASLDDHAEAALASLPLDGFNHPLEGYSRLCSWELSLPNSPRPRVYICIGSASQINVASGHLKYATEAFHRRHRDRALYINVGDPLADFDAQKAEFKSTFDAFIQGPSTEEMIVGFLQALLELSA